MNLTRVTLGCFLFALSGCADRIVPGVSHRIEQRTGSSAPSAKILAGPSRPDPMVTFETEASAARAERLRPAPAAAPSAVAAFLIQPQPRQALTATATAFAIAPPPGGRKVEIQWEYTPVTNIAFNLFWSTNLADWYLATNVPASSMPKVTVTNWPAGKPFEFFKVRASNTLTGAVSDWATNTPKGQP